MKGKLITGIGIRSKNSVEIAIIDEPEMEEDAYKFLDQGISMRYTERIVIKREKFKELFGLEDENVCEVKVKEGKNIVMVVHFLFMMNYFTLLQKIEIILRLKI